MGTATLTSVSEVTVILSGYVVSEARSSALLATRHNRFTVATIVTRAIRFLHRFVKPGTCKTQTRVEPRLSTCANTCRIGGYAAGRSLVPWPSGIPGDVAAAQRLPLRRRSLLSGFR